MVLLALCLETDGIFSEQAHYFFKYLGSFHPVLVHFPIVLNMIVCLIIIGGHKKTLFILPRTEKVLIDINVFVTFLALFVGLLASFNSGFVGPSFEQHRFLGITLGLYALSVSIFYKLIVSSVLCSRLVAFILLLLTLVTGYYGGVLTHGENHFSLEKLNRKRNFNSQSLIQLVPEKLSAAFIKDIQPLLTDKCVECHSSKKRRGGLRLDSLRQIFSGGDSGSVISNKSGTIELIRRLLLPEEHHEFMPKNGDKLPDTKIQLLHQWILDLNASFDIEPEAYHDSQLEDLHLKKVLIPKNDSFHNPIDKFIDRYFLSHNIQWPKQVDNRLLVRRLYLDILGMTPTYEQHKRGLEILERGHSGTLISSLINDNLNYTLHWLTFWNDLLRNDYTGVGFLDNNREQITFWLIKSLYHNDSYVHMIDDIIQEKNGAAGFLKGIVWIGDLEPHQLPAMQAAQNVSSVFLGVDLRCASCHNSFTSDWRLKDVYNFASIFANSPLTITRCGVPSDEKSFPAFLYPKAFDNVNFVDREKRLSKLANALTNPNNGRVARNIVNRIWQRLMGRALIEPVYDMTGTSWENDLLEWLAQDFVDNNFDLKHLMTRIFTSKVYQLERTYNKKNKTGEYIFRGPHVIRMSAEQYIDSLVNITGKWPKKFTKILNEEQNVKDIMHITGIKSLLPRSSLMSNNNLMKILGRPDRSRSISVRDEEFSALQVISLLGNKELQALIDELVVKINEHDLDLNGQIDLLFNLLFYRKASLKEQKLFRNISKLSLHELIWSLTVQANFLYII